MKEKVIQTAGKIWRTLGEKSETSITQLPKMLKEEDEVVYQALGWLAREDKVNYITRNKQTFVSLVEAEQKAFKSLAQRQQASAKNNSPLDFSSARVKPLATQMRKRINI